MSILKATVHQDNEARKWDMHFYVQVLSKVPGNPGPYGHQIVCE